jgi:outer membrane protein assembly factor BamB
MKTRELMFLGIKGYVLALRVDSGVQVWAAKLGSGFVNVMIQNERIFALCQGEISCLDPLSGKQLWHNPLKGYGVGLATMAYQQTANGSSLPAQAEQMLQEEQNASSAALTATMASAA